MTYYLLTALLTVFTLPHSFSVNPRSGDVTVSTCSKVTGDSPCLDYEQKSQYNFTFTVADSSGEGLRGRRLVGWVFYGILYGVWVFRVNLFD